MEHTKGRWKVEEYTGHPHFEIYEIYANKPCQRVASCEDHLSETEANAHLIAACPDLLEACKAIAALAKGQGQVNMIQVAGQAAAAIAKAEGRS